MNAYPCVHVYAQRSEHDDCAIVGSRCALEALVRALEQALASTGKAQAELFTNDGEGFTLAVHCLDQEALDRMVPPYTDSASTLSGVQPHALP